MLIAFFLFRFIFLHLIWFWSNWSHPPDRPPLLYNSYQQGKVKANKCIDELTDAHDWVTQSARSILQSWLPDGYITGF